ncbi:transcriptional regulator [Actinomycetes bacterium]|nr:transcriptional regulator [Actinomycetes bacterium]
MYIPKHFEPSDEAGQIFLRSINSGHLVSHTSAGLIATFIPVNFQEETNSIVGHLARGNQQWSYGTTEDALFISTSNDSYVSPSWYVSKQEHGKVVPTWDYMTAHVYGELVIHDDVCWLRQQVSALTNKFEATRAKPWKLDDAPEDYVAGQLRAIVGIELKVSRIEVSFKMSQNKTKADLDGVIAGLLKDGKTNISDKVSELRPLDKK